MSLTDTEVRQIKGDGVARKVSDEKGLYLLVTAKHHFSGTWECLKGILSGKSRPYGRARA